MQVLELLQLAKRNVLDKATLTSREIKPETIELCLSEGIIQSVG